MLLKENEVNLKKNIAVLNGEIKTISESLEKEKSVLASLEEEYRVQTIRKNTLTNELSTKTREEANLKNKIEILNETIENDTKLPYAVKSVLNNPRLKGIHDVLCKLIDTEEKYVTSLEIALGANANVIVVDDEVAGKNAINYLKDNKLGRATFFPISVIKGRYVDDEVLRVCKSTAGFIDVASNLVQYNPLYKDIVENQLGATLIVNNIDTMTTLGKKIGYRYRIITLDGELLHTGGSMTGGINKASNGIINAKYELTRQINDLNIIVNETKLIEEHINEIDNDLKILEEKIFASRGLVTSIEEKEKGRSLEVQDLNRRLEETENELKGTNNVLKNETDKELDKVLKDYLEVSTNKELLVNKLSDLKSQKNDLSNEINELELQNRKAN
ncbi:MAG: hypothetical protein K2G03_05525, partial [Bacilli bacterium]|nr:hypothetical protein [Bacilli bacterium]